MTDNVTENVQTQAVEFAPILRSYFDKCAKVPLVQDHFKVELSLNQSALDQALSRCSYYPLLTNKSLKKLSIKDAMLAHKKQYKSEHTFRRAKGPYSIEPIYLHTPERIEAFLLLFKIALQLVVLIERTARKNIREPDYSLDNFMPNKKDVRNPRSEYIAQGVRGHCQRRNLVAGWQQIQICV